MRPAIADSVVVVTGASSGIGRATALRLAGEGATVVLAARRGAVLEALARECEAAGGRALAAAVDVTDEQAVIDLARSTIEQLGRIDAWVNNAAVTLFGRLEEVPARAWRRVVESNLFGCMHGARAVIPYFREQGHGVLINVSSIAGRGGMPYLSAYVSSKAAIIAFSECLRQELRDVPDIHVCTVLPASIDTPLFQHAANYTGRAIKPMRPILEADRVVDAILRLIRSPRREVTVGGSGPLQGLEHALLPGLYERATAAQVERDHFQDLPAPVSAGNVLEPVDHGTEVSGGWLTRAKRGGRRIALGGLAAAALLMWLSSGGGPAAWWRAPRGRLAWSW